MTELEDFAIELAKAFRARAKESAMAIRDKKVDGFGSLIEAAKLKSMQEASDCVLDAVEALRRKKAGDNIIKFPGK